MVLKTLQFDIKLYLKNVKTTHLKNFKLKKIEFDLN